MPEKDIVKIKKMKEPCFLTWSTLNPYVNECSKNICNGAWSKCVNGKLSSFYKILEDVDFNEGDVCGKKMLIEEIFEKIYELLCIE
jgi:hypothetical protein